MRPVKRMIYVMSDINNRLRILSRNIVKYRKLAGMTQDDLAREMGVTQARISHWENLPGHPAPSYENLLKLSDILGEPVAHLTGDMKAHDYRTQDAVEFLGIDPAAVEMIREMAGFQLDGSRDPLLDYGRELSAMLVTMRPQETLEPYGRLIEASWNAEPSDDPQEASRRYHAASHEADMARFLIWSAIDASLRDHFPVEEHMFRSKKAEQAAKENRLSREDEVRRTLDGMDDATRHGTLEAMGRAFTDTLGELRREKTLYEDAKARLGKPDMGA